MVFLKMSQCSQGNNCVGVYFDRARGHQVAVFWAPSLTEKENPTQVFFCEYCEIFKNIYFQEYQPTTAELQ